MLRSHTFLSRFDSHFLLLNSRGVAYSDNNEGSKAKSDFNKAINLKPNTAKYYFQAGLNSAGDGHTTAAVKYYAGAIEKNPKYYEAIACRAHLYKESAKHAQAVEDYTAALAIEPSWCSGYCGRGQCREALGHLDEALADYQKAATEDESNPEPHHCMADLYQLSGQELKSTECKNKAKSLE